MSCFNFETTYENLYVLISHNTMLSFVASLRHPRKTTLFEKKWFSLRVVRFL